MTFYANHSDALPYDGDPSVIGYVMGTEGETYGYMCSYHARIALAGNTELTDDGYPALEADPVYSWDCGESDSPVMCDDPDCGELIAVTLTAEGETYVRQALLDYFAEQAPGDDLTTVLDTWARQWPHLDPRNDDTDDEDDDSEAPDTDAHDVDALRAAIITAIVTGLDGEAIAGVNSLIDRFPSLYRAATSSMEDVEH